MNHSQAVCREENIKCLQQEIEVLKKKLAAEKRKSNRHARLSTTDELTKLPNRRAFNAAKRRETARQKRTLTPLSVAIIDLDHFKQINSEHRHAGGDKVLKRFAKLCQATMREIDFMARLGGEEFVMIMPNTTIEEALKALTRIRTAVEGCVVRVDRKTIRFTVSIGVATQSPGGDPEVTLARADQALGQAKLMGRNRVEMAR